MGQIWDRKKENSAYLEINELIINSNKQKEKKKNERNVRNL